ncbi:PWWP domain-containing protein 2A isoform X2 [Anolis sagrei]|uniref:PWWP domain-containing protein 2A isoform X2 n=1 Tax=Anolis sagrei TaxID=38937 RepID=UPI003522E447
MAAVAATAAAAGPGEGSAGEAEPTPGSEAGADPLPAGSQAAVEPAAPEAREEPEPAPGGALQEEPPAPTPPSSPADEGEEEEEEEEAATQGPGRPPQQQQPQRPPEGLPPSPPPPLLPQAAEEGHGAQEEPPLPSPLPSAEGPSEPPRTEEEEEEPGAAAAAAAAAASLAAAAAETPPPEEEEEEEQVAVPAPAGPEGRGGGGAEEEEEEAAEAPSLLLVPGSEVRVTLDHIIEDALVVSFRFGEKLFSGVLMDLSKRFGPHGIPVTIFPKREYKDKPEAMQLQSKPFQDEMPVKCEANGVVTDSSPTQPSEPSLAKSLWTSKPPPLFHEGAPYPPPLFIRDTYNQSIPQPPPRKIKRPKRKMYREEPTSIMNAIKLRPRQVLCDKCKNSIVAEKKEIKKGSNVSDSPRYEDSRKRRNESITTVNKKIKTDHKVDGKSQNESQKKNSVVKVANIAHSRSKVVKVPTQANTSKTQLNTKKVLQSKNMDHAKAREVLKIAKEKAQKKQSATSTSKNAHSKVHFTRRLQNTSSGSLPPRLRLKPQRYRNEENDSSLKTGLEKLQSGKMAAKPQSRCSSTRSADRLRFEFFGQSDSFKCKFHNLFYHLPKHTSLQSYPLLVYKLH